ncbi:MAG TPA: VanZ family protein, partial [Acholeplasmataceae bacterium]|nr:VanZ family protein [Acholeplasmataceae bacterium]
IIRKGAHFFEFFLLAIFLYNYFKYLNIVKNSHKYYKNVSIYTFLIVLGICVMIAATDEFIQLFVENRVGSIIDVLIDTSGSIFGLGLIALLNYKKIKSSLNND